MQQVRIDFDNPGLPQSLGVVEGESQSRLFQAALYKSGAAYTAPAGAVYSIMYRGFGPQNQGWYDTIEDGAGKRAACTVSGNVVTCELARQALRVPGHLTVVLCVSDAKGYMLKSWPIMADVRNDGYEDTGEIEMYFNLSGLAGNYLTQLEKAMADAEAIKNNLTSTSAQVQKDIDAKAAAALESIPESYTELDGSVKQLKEDLESNANLITRLGSYDLIKNEPNDKYNADNDSYYGISRTVPYNGYITKVIVDFFENEIFDEYQNMKIKFCKFNLTELKNGANVTNFKEFDDEYLAFSGHNEIKLAKPIFVEKGCYIGIKTPTNQTETHSFYPLSIYPFENASYGFIRLSQDNTSCKLYLKNYALLLDFEIANKKYIETHNDPLAGKTLVCYGDSITAGFGTTGYQPIIDKGSNNKAESYVRLLGNYHAMNYYNFGRGGSAYNTNDKVQDAYYMINTYKKPLADIVTVAFGTNDYGLADERNIDFGTLNDMSTDNTFCGGVVKTFELVSNYYSDALILILLPMPRKNGLSPNGKGKTLRDYSDAIKYFAIKYGFAVYDFSENMPVNLNNTNFMNNYFDGGDLHPNDRGHKTLVFPQLNAYIENMSLNISELYKYHNTAN